MGIVKFIDAANDLVNDVLVPLAFSLCLFYFFWGVVKYLRAAGDEKTLQDGRRVMIWGVVGLFVAVSVWGIVSFVQTELGIPSNIQEVKKL